MYSLPYPVSNAKNIVADADETFAIITVEISTCKTVYKHSRNSGIFLIFTEKHGFEELSSDAFEEVYSEGMLREFFQDNKYKTHLSRCRKILLRIK